MIDGWITQLRKGVLEYCVLLELRRGESYGYEIVQALSASRISRSRRARCIRSWGGCGRRGS